MEGKTDTADRTGHLQGRILSVGEDLSLGLRELIEAIPNRPRGPVALARELGIDKVLASRVIKAARAGDPLATLHLAPGPEPLRRVIRGAARLRLSEETIARTRECVNQFDLLIRQEAGDRSALEAMISAWLPEARREFEVRRKQAVFRAMSQLKGASMATSLSTVFLHPSEDGSTLDVVWLFGMLGLQRHRPGATVKFTSRRIARDREPRRPMTLDLVAVEDVRGLRLDAFSSKPPPELDVHEAGEVVRYMVTDKGFGPNSLIDLVFAEVNLSEIERDIPPGSGRRAYFFVEVTTPAKRLVFDLLLHKAVYPGRDPYLIIYDTASEGVASVNDRSRDVDRLDIEETIRPLGTGVERFRVAAIPLYAEMLRTVCSKLGWDGGSFHGYRCEIEYPIYGSQVTMVFDPPQPGRD